jgi:hypothetical protein
MAMEIASAAEDARSAESDQAGLVHEKSDA